MIGYGAYNVLWAIASPAGKLWLRHHAEHRALLARFRPPEISIDAPLWVHACSVGEVNTAKAILAALRARFPGQPILLTTATVSGYAQAQKVCGDFPVAWCPFDAARPVRRFLDRLRPRLLALIETELWPNMLRECHRRNIPVVLLNGRISEKHFSRYQRFHAFFEKALGHLSLAGMQNESYAQRLVSLGADPAVVRVVGNTKFDAVATEMDARGRARLRAENGFSPDQPVLIFGSTRPGDEAIAARCWQVLREEYPALRLIVAPRHLDRLAEAMAPFEEESLIRRSEIRAGRLPAGERILVLDTMGELTAFYAIASVAVVGGSFSATVNGHNPLEPAALGVPAVFGPFMGNFPDPAKILLQARGAIQVENPEELPGVLRRLLADATERHCYGTRARKAVLDNRGATERCVDLVQELLSPAPGKR